MSDDELAARVDALEAAGVLDGSVPRAALGLPAPAAADVEEPAAFTSDPALDSDPVALPAIESLHADMVRDEVREEDRLRRIITIARENGVTVLKYDGIELHLGPRPHIQAASSERVPEAPSVQFAAGLPRAPRGMKVR